jgi:hypothetical protein
MHADELVSSTHTASHGVLTVLHAAAGRIRDCGAHMASHIDLERSVAVSGSVL